MKTAYKLIVALSVLFSLTAQVSAEAEKKEFDVLKLVTEDSGYVIYPLALLSIVTLMMVFFFFITVRRDKVVSDAFMGKAENLIRKHDYLGLVSACNQTSQSMARITEKTLDFMTKNTGVSFREVREVAQAEGSRQAGILTNRISYLSDAASIATMLGLLGTVIGIIQAFMEISQGNVDGAQQVKVAEGIYPALVTTGVGLCIGIVALVFYSIFRGKVQKYLAELEAAATHLLALLSAQYNRRSGTAPQQFFDDPSEVGTIGEDFALPQVPVGQEPQPIEEKPRAVEGI